jgi:hypothetical protein
MRNAKLAVLACGMIVLGSGCIITSDDDTVDNGVFHATWSVNGSTSPSACTAPIEKVSFLFTQDSTSQGFDEVFDCFDFSGNTGPLPLDGYTYVATLLDCPTTETGCPGGDPINATQPLEDNFDTCSDISGGHCFVDLPLIAF